MFRLEGSCIHSDVLLKTLRQLGWEYRVNGKKTKTVRFHQLFASNQNAHEARGMLHRALYRQGIHATFTMVHWEKAS